MHLKLICQCKCTNLALFAALPDLPGVRPLSWRRADLLTIELMREHNIIMPITWDVRTEFNKCDNSLITPDMDPKVLQNDLIL